MFNPEEKKQRHETVFPQEMEKAYEIGADLRNVRRKRYWEDEGKASGIPE